MIDTECRRSCPCKANTAREAMERTAGMIGIDREKASALLAILAANGWDLVKR